MRRSGRYFAATFIILSLIVIISNPAYAADGIVFEKTFTIGKWHLYASQHILSTDVSGEVILKIGKNDFQKEIQRGFIVINGSFTFLHDFWAGDEFVFEKAGKGKQKRAV